MRVFRKGPSFRIKLSHEYSATDLSSSLLMSKPFLLLCMGSQLCKNFMLDFKNLLESVIGSSFTLIHGPASLLQITPFFFVFSPLSDVISNVRRPLYSSYTWSYAVLTNSIVFKQHTRQLIYLFNSDLPLKPQHLVHSSLLHVSP